MGSGSQRCPDSPLDGSSLSNGIAHRIPRLRDLGVGIGEGWSESSSPDFLEEEVLWKRTVAGKQIHEQPRNFRSASAAKLISPSLPISASGPKLFSANWALRKLEGSCQWRQCIIWFLPALHTVLAVGTRQLCWFHQRMNEMCLVKVVIPVCRIERVDVGWAQQRWGVNSRAQDVPCWFMTLAKVKM